MTNKEKKTKDKNSRIFLFILFIVLIGLGVWKCSNLSFDEKLAPELVQKKENSVDLETIVKTNIAKENPPSTKNELKDLSEKAKKVPVKAKEENISNSSTIIKEKVLPKIKEEVVSETSAEKTTINSNEASFQETIIVYNADKKIDKRLPASSNSSCKATTTLKIDKSSIQTSVAISPDGSNFAAGNHNNYVSVMNLEGNELFRLIGHKGYVQSIKYNPDGRFILTGSMDHTAKLWDANDGKELMSLKGHTEGILSVAYSSNGKFIATGSLDHTTILWEAKSGKKIHQMAGHRSEITEVAFSTNSKFVITGSSDGTAKVWDIETGKILYSLDGHDGVVGGVAFTPNDKLITTSSVDKIRLWNAETGKHIHTINDNHARIMSIFISNDGKYISSSTVKGLIKIWQIKGGEKLCEYKGHTKRAREAIFHPTMKNTVISVSNDKTIRMWKFESE